MGRINFSDIYNQGIDLDDLAKYYVRRKEQEKKEEQENKEIMRKEAREAAATAIHNYFNIICPGGADDITIEEITRNLIDLEKKYDAATAHKGRYRGYSATKKNDEDWDIKFEGDYTAQEKKEIKDRLRR